MEFKNGYKLLYQKANKKIYASKKAIPTDADEQVDLGLTEEQIASIKLVYENKDGLVASLTDAIPSSDDKEFTLTIDGEVVFGPSGEEPTPPTPPTPEPVDPIQENQILKVGDKIHFDTTADMDSLLSDLDYTESEPYPYSIITQTSAGNFLVEALDASDQNKEKYAMVLLNGTPTAQPVYATEPMQLTAPGMEISFNGGFETIDDNGDIEIEYQNSGEYVSIAPPVSWNGTVIGKVEEPAPVSELLPIEHGHIFNQDDVIYFDTEKSAELEEYLSTLDFNENPMQVLVSAAQSIGGFALNIVAIKQDNQYSLLAMVGMAMVTIYTTADSFLTGSYTVPVDPDSQQYYYTVEYPETVDPAWNGTIIGIKEV